MKTNEEQSYRSTIYFSLHSNDIMMNKEIMHCQTNCNVKIVLQFLDQMVVLEKSHEVIHIEVLYSKEKCGFSQRF